MKKFKKIKLYKGDVLIVNICFGDLRSSIDIKEKLKEYGKILNELFPNNKILTTRFDDSFGGDIRYTVIQTKKRTRNKIKKHKR